MSITEDGVAPRLIGRYMLHREIAAGGTASVHLGRLLGSVGFTRTVAIKRLHAAFASDPTFVKMFLDEARLAARVRHPNVVPVLDVVALNGEVFLVMEYVQGESLSRLIKANKNRPLQASVAVSIMTGALYGLHAAHEATNERGQPLQMVHRDVSPQNILVGIDGIARVTDFGIAKAVNRLQTTQEGQLKGKLPYMAPEMLRSKPVDRRADVYAASVVLWEALTGQRLFEAQGPASTAQAVLEAPVAPPSQLNSQIPSVLDELVLRGLSRDPDARFATARDMALELERAVVRAPAALVTQWVERIARPVLDQRSRWISEVESTPLGDPPQPNISDASLQRAISPPPTAPAVPPSVRASGTDFQVTLAPSLLKPRRNTGLFVALGSLGAVLAIAALGIGGWTIYRSRNAAAHGANANQTAAPITPVTPAPEPVAVAPAPVAPSAPEPAAGAAAPPAIAPAQTAEPAASDAKPAAKSAPAKASTATNKPAAKPVKSKGDDGFGDLTRF